MICVPSVSTRVLLHHTLYHCHLIMRCNLTSWRSLERQSKIVLTWEVRKSKYNISVWLRNTKNRTAFVGHAFAPAAKRPNFSKQIPHCHVVASGRVHITRKQEVIIKQMFKRRLLQCYLVSLVGELVVEDGNWLVTKGVSLLRLRSLIKNKDV